jgi:hypothetical protein
MSAKSKGQLTLAVAVLQMDMRDLTKRVKAIEADWLVLLIGMAISAGIMLGYLASFLVQK